MEIKALGKKYKIKEITYKERRELHRLNAKAFWDGKINPEVSDSFSLDDGAQAIAHLKDRKAKGKVIIKI